MGNVIDLGRGHHACPDNVITSRPWEFRKSDWGSAYFVQMLKSQSVKLEEQRRNLYAGGHDRAVRQLPPCHTLKGGVGHTVQSLYLQRHHESKMRDIYYLAGLVDCLINQVNPVLRTSGIRDLYKKVTTLQTLLCVRWQGPLDQVLCPIDRHLFNDLDYRQRISAAKTMDELYGQIREGAENMFDILSQEYVFYAPGATHERWHRRV